MDLDETLEKLFQALLFVFANCIAMVFGAPVNYYSDQFPDDVDKLMMWMLITEWDRAADTHTLEACNL